jgi:hypothetical protein
MHALEPEPFLIPLALLSLPVCRLNVKFTDRMKRIKVPLPPTDEKKKVRVGRGVRTLPTATGKADSCSRALSP